MKALVASLLLGSVLIGSACAQDAPASDTLQLEGVAALVNDEPITFFDVRQRVRMLLVTLQAEPTEEILQQLGGTALEQLVDERLQLQQAKEFELEVSEDRIADSINRLAQQAGGTKESMESEFNQAGISMRTLEEQTRADIAWNIIIRERFGRNIRISKDRIDAQMEQIHTDSQDTSYQLAEIFLAAPDEETKAQALAGAYTLIEQLKQGVPFGAMANQLSSASTAATGGDMGWVTVDDLDPTVVEAVTGATTAGLLEPIVADNGVYIMVLRGKREPQELISQISLTQLVATDNNASTLRSGMRNVESCGELNNRDFSGDDLIVANIGTIAVDELADQPKSLIADLAAGEFSEPFEMSRGLATLIVCDRMSGAEGLPTNDQIENQLYGREIRMISERELRNMRNDATILR